MSSRRASKYKCLFVRVSVCCKCFSCVRMFEHVSVCLTAFSQGVRVRLSKRMDADLF